MVCKSFFLHFIFGRKLGPIVFLITYDLRLVDCNSFSADSADRRYSRDFSSPSLVFLIKSRVSFFPLC